jgi:hypothetical protein
MAGRALAAKIGVVMLSRDEARNLVDRIFKMGKSPEMSANLRWQQECNTRFANNQITTAGFTSDLRLDISVTRGTRLVAPRPPRQVTTA